MYAVIATGGKQERVEVGSRIEVELLGAQTGDEVNFSPVLLVDGPGIVSLPAALAKAVVSGRVVGESKGPKITGFTYKAKARGRRRYGHRQHYSTVEITKIVKTKTAVKAKA
ncbi:MAG TPA: 50S ribosomal protein L21 [Acidimicrobiales bacterium]|nr:50S ribosomal protein L21 [Acidimicrobiales bacterium]